MQKRVLTSCCINAEDSAKTTLEEGSSSSTSVEQSKADPLQDTEHRSNLNTAPLAHDLTSASLSAQAAPTKRRKVTASHVRVPIEDPDPASTREGYTPVIFRVGKRFLIPQIADERRSFKGLNEKQVKELRVMENRKYTRILRENGVNSLAELKSKRQCE